MLSGDNGILQKATDAKTNTDNAQIQEQINLAYHSALVDGQGKVTESSLESEIKREFNKNSLDEGWLDKTSVEGKWRITIDGISLNVPAGIEQPTIQVDESEKLYNNLKDKTPQEIKNGVIVDGIQTIFITASGTNATIEYNNQQYIVSLNPSNGSVSSVELVKPVTFGENITFYVHRANEGNDNDWLPCEAKERMTFRDWITTYSPDNFYDNNGYVQYGSGHSAYLLQHPTSGDMVSMDREIEKDTRYELWYLEY